MYSHAAGQSRDDTGELVTTTLLSNITKQQLDSMKSGADISVRQLTFCIEIFVWLVIVINKSYYKM